jgi:hypothetical protein
VCFLNFIEDRAMTASDEGERWPADLRFEPLEPDAERARARMDQALAKLAPPLRLAATILAYSDSGLEAHLRTAPPAGLNGRDLLLQLNDARWTLDGLADRIRAAQFSLLAVMDRNGVSKG